MSMNKVMVIGNMVKDAEVTTINGSNGATSKARFTVACQRPKTKTSEDGKTDFIPCVAWGKTAENIAKFFQKGSKIGVFGRFETGNYKNKEDKTVYTYEVNVSEFEFIDNKNSQSQTGSQATQASFDSMVDSEELPFN